MVRYFPLRVNPGWQRQSMATGGLSASGEKRRTGQSHNRKSGRMARASTLAVVALLGSRTRTPVSGQKSPPAAMPANDGYQSDPSTSPELGVQAANQVELLTPCASRRTLPSPMPTLIPPVCGDTARHMQTLAAPPQVQGVVVD